MEAPDDDGLVLDVETHRYSIGGTPVGGVSEILQAIGIVDPRWFKSYARDRGTAVHTALEYLARGVLDWATVDPRIEGYVRAGEAFLRDAEVPIGDVMTEHLVYHPALRYAGRLDLFAKAFGGPAVIDWKSGGLGHANLATAAYEEALRIELGSAKPFRRMAVQLREDGTYRKHDFYLSADFAHWSACCLIFNNYLSKKGQRNAD